MMLIPSTHHEMKLWPEWQGFNEFLGIDPESEEGRQNDKEAREEELMFMKYADGSAVEEPVDLDREVRMYCRIHGEFLLTPRLHLTGSGCPVCNRMGEDKLYPTTR